MSPIRHKVRRTVTKLLLAWIAVYGIFLGGWLGGRLGLSDDPKVLAQLGGGVLFLALGLGAANLYGKVRRETFTPIITEVIDADPTALKLEVRVVGNGRTD